MRYISILHHTIITIIPISACACTNTHTHIPHAFWVLFIYHPVFFQNFGACAQDVLSYSTCHFIDIYHKEPANASKILKHPITTIELNMLSSIIRLSCLILDKSQTTGSHYVI